MSDITLSNIIEEWTKEELQAPFYFEKDRIFYPCECGSSIQFAVVWVNEVTLIATICSCINCDKRNISIADPNSLDSLKNALMSRIKHNSINMSNQVGTGDDLEHAIHHHGTVHSGETINVTGKLDGVNVNVANVKLVFKDAHITNCTFNDIIDPITVMGDNTIIGCAFYSSPKAPLTALMMEY